MVRIFFLVPIFQNPDGSFWQFVFGFIYNAASLLTYLHTFLLVYMLGVQVVSISSKEKTTNIAAYIT